MAVPSPTGETKPSCFSPVSYTHLVDGSTAAALAQNQLKVYDVLQNNDAYHALKAVDGLIITGATGTNVNDVAVVLIGNQG